MKTYQIHPFSVMAGVVITMLVLFACSSSSGTSGIETQDVNVVNPVLLDASAEVAVNSLPAVQLDAGAEVAVSSLPPRAA